MSDRMRVQRRRARAREEQGAGVPSLAGAVERPSSAAVGGRTGAIDAVVAEATQAGATPNAILDSKATADIVQGTIAQVVARAAEQTPTGHRFADIDVFARDDELATDDEMDGSNGEAPETIKRSRARDDASVATAVADEEVETAEEEEQQETAAETEAEAADAFEENAKLSSAPPGGSAPAAPPSPPPDAGGDASSNGGAATESATAESAPAARAARPSEALVEAVGDSSTTDLDVESAQADERSEDAEVEAEIEAVADEIGVEAMEAGVEIEAESVDVEAVEVEGVEDVADVEHAEPADALVAEGEAAEGEADGGGDAEGGGGGGGGAKGAGGKGGRGKAGGRGGRGAAAGAGGGKGGGGGGGAGGGRGGGAGRAGARGGAAGAAAAMGGGNARELPALPTGSIALIDEELVEHQRWAGAAGAVGQAGSLDRAAFVADTAGGAALSGLASGAAMGLGIGLATRALSFIPGLGPTIGGVMALHGLSQKFENWDQTSATITRFGEGNSTYEVLANSIASVAEVVDIVSQVLNAINGVVGVLTMICYGITAAGAIATVATLGAAAPILAAAAEISAVLTEIGAAITTVTTVLDVITSAVLQPAVLLFRAMHTFTSEADPREVEASGGQIAQAAAAWGGTLGAKAGGALAEVGSGGAARGEGEEPGTQRTASDAEAHATQPAAGGGAGAAGPDGPTVQFEAPAGAAGVDVNAPTHVDSPAAHADTVPMAIPGGGVDVNAPTHVDSPAAHADTVPMAAVGGGPVDVNAPTHVDSPAAHADTVPMAVPEPGVSPMATTGEMPAPGVSPMATTGEMPAAGTSPMAQSVETPAVGAVDPTARTEVDPLGRTQADPLGQTQVDPLGQTQVDPLGQTQVDPFGQTQVDPLGQTQPGTPAGVEPPPNAGLGGVEGWPPHDPYPGDHASMGDRLAWGMRQYEPGGQWHSEPLPPPTPPPPAPEPAPWVGPPRNPVMEMTAVNPADVYPGAPQPPGFQAGPVGSLGTPDVPTSGSPPPAAPALPGQRNPVIEMTPVNPADVYPGAPQPPGFQAGPVGSLDLPPSTPMPSTPMPSTQMPDTLPQTHFDVPAAHAPTNLDIPAAHAPTQQVDVVPAGSGTLPGIGPAAAASDVEPIPVQTGQTLPGIGPEPVATTAAPSSGGGSGGNEPPSSGSGGSGGGGGPPNPFADLSDAEIAAGLNAPGHSDLMLSAPAPAAPTRFSDASDAEIQTAIDNGLRQAERRGTVNGQPANLSDDFRNLTPAEQAALITDPGTVRPGPAPDQPGPGGSRHNISNGMMVDEVTIRSQSGRPGETGDVPTVIRVHTADLDPSLPATSNSATGNTVTVTQGNQGARGQGVRMVPAVDADGNPVQAWHPTATASDDVMNASHIPIHRGPPAADGSVPPQSGGTLPGLGPTPPNGGTPSGGSGGGGSASSGATPVAREPSVIVDEAALGLPPGSVVTTEPTTPRPAPAGPQTDVDWSQMRVEYDRDPAGTVTGSRLMYDNNGKSYPIEFDPQRNSFDPSAPPGPGPFAGTVGMPNYRHAPTTLADGTVVHHPPEFKPEAYITTTPAEGGFGARVGPGGAWMDHTFPTQPEADAYSRTVAQGDAARGTAPSTEADIRDRSALPVGWPPDAAGTVWPGNPVDNMNVHPLPPRMPQIFSQVAPQPEGDPRAGAGRVYPGGGPQVQIPKGIVHPGSVPVASYPIQRSGFPPPEGGAFTPVPPGHPARSGSSRTPTLPGIGPAPQAAGSLGGTTRVASDMARTNVGGSPATSGGSGAGGSGRAGGGSGGGGASITAITAQQASDAAEQRERERTTPSSAPTTAPQAAPSTAEQVGQLFLPQVFGPDAGPQPTAEQRQAAHNAHFTGDNQAPEGVERVNPAYPAPPGTPQQLEQIQTEITNLLAARARTEQAERRMAGQEAKHRAGEAPIQQAIDDTAAGVSASQAQQQSVARHAAANQEQQSRQQQGAGLVSGYPSRAAGLAVLTVPLGIFEGFTRYASILPGDAGDAMARMNADARRMQDAFGQMAATMLTQEEAQPARQGELQGDQQRLQTTDAQASDSTSELGDASQGAQELQRANQQKLGDATQAKEEAAQQKVELGDAAAQKTEQAQTLSAQLEAWAPAHKGARDEAVQETEARLQEEGYVVLPRSS